MNPHLRLCTPLALTFCLAAHLAAAPPETAPAFDWAASAGGAKNEKTRAINIDREGNVFLAGEATDEVKFGDNDLYGAKLKGK